MEDLFKLREPKEADLPFLNAFNFAEGMDNLETLDGVTVAANDNDEPVGYIRIAIGSSGNAFVNPVVVYKTWRRYGVGRALMEHALRQYGEMRLVSRGASIPFYKSLGYEECSWGEIDEGVSEDCENCSWRDECGPLPMKKSI